MASSSGVGAAEVRTWITERRLEPEELVTKLGTRSDGAVLLFVGRVREMNAGRRVTRVGYEAYREMAEAELAAIVREVAEESPVGAIAAVHRVGVLTLGEVSVAVAVAAPHRDACYAASRAVIEAVKKRLPIWKREEYADGSVAWVGSEGIRQESSGVSG
ncbi:MAG: molybdenum cofactor biosynthesis protein MoaE [Gemmatimonadota bacterium]